MQRSNGYEFYAMLVSQKKCGIHTDRAVGCYCDYRHFGVDAVARAFESEIEGNGHKLRQQPETIVYHLDHVRRRQQREYCCQQQWR